MSTRSRKRSKPGKPKKAPQKSSAGMAKLAQAALIDLSAAAFETVVRGADRRDFYEAASKAYDRAVSLANDATARLYNNPEFTGRVRRSIEMWLEWQRLNAAMAGAFFAAIWPAIGLPTADAVEGIRADIRRLRDELRESIADRETVRSALPASRPVRVRGAETYAMAVWPGGLGGDPMTEDTDVSN
jgi:hypothetical protein